MERKEVLTEIAAALHKGVDYVEAEIAKLNGNPDSGGGGSTGTQAIWSDDLVEQTSINTHINWRSSVWGTNPAWKQAFIDLGLRYTRSGMFNNKGAIQDWKDIGAKLIYVSGDGDNINRTEVAASLDVLVANPDITFAIEGPNEPNEGYHEGWAQRTKDYQAWLYDEVKKRPAIASKHILGPSVWSCEDAGYAALGDMSDDMTIGNLHYYTGGCKPTVTAEGPDSAGAGSLDEAIADAKGLAPGLPIWITETGWSVAGPGCAISQWFVTDNAQAKYIPRMLMEAFIRGIKHCALYTLMDDDRNPPRYHGLTKQDMSKRPAYAALKRTLAVYAQTGAKPTTLGKLEYQVSAPASVHQLPLMQKSDGRFLITLWNDVDSYNRKTFVDINPAPVQVSLSFGKSLRFRSITPVLGWEWVDLPAGDHISVPVPDHPIALEVY
jgi:hypothetical protein